MANVHKDHVNRYNINKLYLTPLALKREKNLEKIQEVSLAIK